MVTHFSIFFSGPGVNLGTLDTQWSELAFLSLPDICEDVSDDVKIDDVDIVHFWACVLNYKNAGGEQPFKELALFVLALLTLPISNAVVERAFSVMSCIKARRRNRLQLRMLEALMRVRIHMKVFIFGSQVLGFVFFSFDCFIFICVSGGRPMLRFVRAKQGHADPVHLRNVQAPHRRSRSGRGRGGRG